jgi:hypothetical protein
VFALRGLTPSTLSHAARRARLTLHLYPLHPPCTRQRAREASRLLGTDDWDVELVEDEQWGRVLVAQRDFAPGEVVIRSRFPILVRSAAAYVQAALALAQEEQEGRRPAVISHFIKWANASTR